MLSSLLGAIDIIAGFCLITITFTMDFTFDKVFFYIGIIEIVKGFWSIYV
jgi:hypothetical protein